MIETKNFPKTSADWLVGYLWVKEVERVEREECVKVEEENEKSKIKI